LLLCVVVFRLCFNSCWALLVEGDSDVGGGNVIDEHSGGFGVHELGIMIRGISGEDLDEAWVLNLRVLGIWGKRELHLIDDRWTWGSALVVCSVSLRIRGARDVDHFFFLGVPKGPFL
jgi:hypothetical protein